MNDIELHRRLDAIERQLVGVQKIELALRDQPAAPPAPGGQVVDILPGLSLVLMLLAEIGSHADRLRHLEVNMRCREANARRHRRLIADGLLPPARPVGRPKGSTNHTGNGAASPPG